MSGPILELRVAITAQDYERVVAFYETALGLEPAQLWTTEKTRAGLYELGRGTLEIFDEAHAASVDEIETGARTSSPIRFALEVPDLDAALERALAAGATLVHEPVVTPWNDRNARLQAPDGLQVTLFEVMGGKSADAQ
jgi:catechol 2,3-dioxygenase-like lactoylglutathione lyase family enzyme